MSLPQMMITFSAIQLTDPLISHAVLLFLVRLVHAVINYTAIIRRHCWLCLFPF